MADLPGRGARLLGLVDAMTVRLIASLVVRNELGRYLEPCVDHLLEFCDEIAILDDGSDDGFPAALASYRRSERVHVHLDTLTPRFFTHEGTRRQTLLDFTLSRDPTHVLAIDADELVSDGAAVRRACETDADVFALDMLEVWEAQPDCLCIRGDGGWLPHPVHPLWRVPADTSRLRIADRALACGRVPTVVDQTPGVPTGVSIFHFGWANETERVARHQRYAVADGGRFHSSRHLDSILWPDEQVAMQGVEWPDGLLPYRDRILERTSKGAHVV
jgi:hypothetical protein